MRPFLKWAGSKKWLVRRGVERPAFERYIEPFLGSGAVFFHLLPRVALLADSNDYLINCFRQIKDCPEDVFHEYEELFRQHTVDEYYRVRDKLETGSVLGAAQFLYLNRTCFNGIFRVNLSGKFNVPLGSKINDPFSLADFLQWASALKGASLYVSDFEKIIDEAGPGDFVFADPPYTVAHNKNGFIEYNEKIFSWDDQVRLAECLKRASLRGANFLLTNADHESVRGLYEPDFGIESLDRRSAIAANVAKRRPISEVLIRSFSS